jgi:hypothetical protein
MDHRERGKATALTGHRKNYVLSWAKSSVRANGRGMPGREAGEVEKWRSGEWERRRDGE